MLKDAIRHITSKDKDKMNMMKNINRTVYEKFSDPGFAIKNCCTTCILFNPLPNDKFKTSADNESMLGTNRYQCIAVL